jgi:hypothetical protein
MNALWEPLFYIGFVLVHLVVAAPVVGVLLLFSNLLRSRPRAALPLISCGSSALLAIWTAWSTWRTAVEIGFDAVSFLDPHFLEQYWVLIALGTIFGCIVGLLTSGGTLLWRGDRHSRPRTVIGITLVVLSWIILGLGLAAETFSMLMWWTG